MKQSKEEILEVFRPFLWYLDMQKIDLERHKRRIITNVLNLGTREATDLLFEVYDKDEIKRQVEKSMPGEWSDKSYNYWSIYFGFGPRKIKHVLRHIG